MRDSPWSGGCGGGRGVEEAMADDGVGEKRQRRWRIEEAEEEGRGIDDWRRRRRLRC